MAATPGPTITRNTGLPKGVLGRIGVTASPAQAGARLGAGRGRRRRDVPLGRLRRDVGARLRRPDLRRRPWYYMHAYADPQESEHGLGAESELLAVDRRRQDLRGDPDAARRQPRPVDRPAQLEAHDRGQRRRRVRHLRRRPLVVQPAQPADGAVLSRHHRRAGAVPRLRLRSRTTGRCACPASASRARSPGRITSSRAAARAATSPSRASRRTWSSAAASAPASATGD